MSSSYLLQILCTDEKLRELYTKRANHADDAGVDLYVPQTTQIPSNDMRMVDHQIRCKMLNANDESVSYFLFARSSIAKTPLILANGVGIIDSNYRGPIISALRNVMQQDYEIPQYTRLVQICAPNLGSIRVVLVDRLDDTARGSGGFGSTGSA
jgi:dUTP pyrophosphatase